MTDVMTSAPAAAWYPDPAQPELLRWWDGSSWSVHTMARPDARTAIEDPRPAPAPTRPRSTLCRPCSTRSRPSRSPTRCRSRAASRSAPTVPSCTTPTPQSLPDRTRRPRRDLRQARELARCRRRCRRECPGRDPFGDFSTPLASTGTAVSTGSSWSRSTRSRSDRRRSAYGCSPSRRCSPSAPSPWTSRSNSRDRRTQLVAV